MNNFTLEPYKGRQSRYTCPECLNRTNTFSRYINTETGEHLAGHVGRCSRADKCGYHFTPRDFFSENPGANRPPINNMNMQPPSRYFSTIPPSVMLSTLRGYDKNIFTMFLAQMFGADEAIALIEKYKIGCAKHWPGATVFWQVDTNDHIRTGKIMLYSGKDCRRIKQPYNHIAWVHRLLKKSGSRESQQSPEAAATAPPANRLSGFRTSGLSDYQLKQCLFGEHLLALEPFKTVAITESEKTAIIASRYYPNYIWLAAGSLDGLNADKCRVLHDRTVRLFPDVNGYAKWHRKVAELNARIPSATFKVDDTLERTATPADRQRGIDIADKWIDDKLLEWEVEREMGEYL